MRVLVIEDEQRLASNIARSLREGAGYAVDCAHDGEEGLYMAESNLYDLIVLDLWLPGIDGGTILRRVRAGGNATPVLILTARDDRQSIIDLLNAGGG
jgi:two-component system response regulator PhoP